ncbi:MAG: metallophosphoesterase, partial [Clostridia bacterium]|nr:metallophosphoesterase [Clostridia bacterium]
MKKILKILILVLIIVIFVLFSAFDNRLKIVNYNLKTDKVLSNVKLALVTDLHCCLYGKDQRQLIHAIDKNKPDAVLL